MKRIFDIKRIVSAVLLVVAATLASCSEWTDQESLEIATPKIDNKNGALYGQYLQNLRDYKKSYHQLLIGWFDNSQKSTASRAGRLASLPDSVDVVSLLSPDNLTGKEIADIATLQKDKGTKVIYTIDYEGFAAGFQARKAAAAEAGTPFTEDFMAELTKFMDSSLALIPKYNYDGASIRFNGYSSRTLTPAELTEYNEIQDLVFGKISAVVAKPDNAGKLFIFEGHPQFVTDTDVLGLFSYIVINTHGSHTCVQDVDFEVLKSLTPGVPPDRIVVTAIPFKLHIEDEDRGVFGGDKSAITEIAYWMSATGTYRKAGLGIYRINDDYYNAVEEYMYVRAAIDIMNPSAKK